MKTALLQLGPYLSEEFVAAIVLGTSHEITVFRAGHCVAVIPLTVAEFGCLVRAVHIPQQFRPVREMHRALHQELLQQL
jgi:hypothetical protein